MQWQVMDNGKDTDHAAIEKCLQADVEAMQAEGGAMDIAGLERRGFEAVRRQMEGAARILKAEECKVEANQHFASKDWLPSLVGYMAGIWFIQRGEPPCPAIVASQSDDAAFDEVPAMLGSGSPVFGRPEAALPKDVEAQVEALRVTLHLNLAAAALRLEKYTIARTACEYVLMVQGAAASSKARYRLAKAMEGQGNGTEAISVLERLLELDPGNADAQKLLQALRELQPAPQAKAPSSAAPQTKAPSSAAEPATSPSTRYAEMGAAEWAKLSKEEQWKAIMEINQGLDAEMGESPPLDSKALEAALGPIQ